MQRILKWVFILLVLMVVGVIGAYFLAKKYEEPVRNYIVSEVNKRLDAPVHVGDINFSLLERFPSASLVMDSVWAEENIVKIGKPDTLLFFRKMYLNLNIFDIIDGQYKINEIEGKDGFVRLLVDEKGYDNFHIWKTSKDTTGFLLELSKVHVENGELRYVNQARDQDIRLLANNLWFTGKFSEDNYTMAVKGDGLVHSFSLKGTDYLRNRQVEVESDLDIITESETYAFRKGRLVIDNVLDFNVSGKFEGDGIDLHIKGNDLDIIRSMSLIPSESRTWFEEYSSSGSLDFDCTLTGAFGKTDNPRLRMDFTIVDGEIAKKGSKWELTHLKGKGSLDNGETRDMNSTVLILDQLRGEFNNDTFLTHFSVRNFLQPTIEGSAKLNTSIEALDEFLDLAFIEEATGQLVIDASLKTTLTNPGESSARDFLNPSANGSIQIRDAKLRLKDDQRRYRIDSAFFQVQNNALVISAYEGRINDCQISVDGRADHFLDYFFTDQGKLKVSGSVIAGDIDLQALFPSKGDDAKEGSVVIAFPSRASWNLGIVAKSFSNGKFRAEEISGRLVMNEFKVEASSLHFLSQDGNIGGKAGIYRFAENQFGLKTDFEATDVDVKTLFQTFNNFEQKFITSEHLSGRANADVQFQGFCDSTLVLNTSSIIANADLTITDGALTNFKPLVSVADEIKKKPMLRLFVSTDELRKRLENVQFAELSNQISIRNGVVTIPQMEIKSSAVDLNISGTHSFDNHIDYSMDFALSELLELKDRKEPYNEFVQRDKKGKTRIYLTMKGTTDDFKVELERTNVKTTIKDDMISEKNAVKGLLKEEFNVFSKDTNANYVEPEEEKLNFEFDPEAGTAGEQQDTKETVKEPTEAKDKNLLNRFIKKTESNKKELKDGEFEDDDF